MFELVQNNPLLITLNIVMLIAMWYTMRPAIRYADGEVSSGRLYFTLFMWFAFDVFSFWGSDWFHLYVRYKEIMAGHPTVEYIYTWIAFHLAPFNYILFRIIVWGSAQLLLWDAFKRLSVSSHLVLAVFDCVDDMVLVRQSLPCDGSGVLGAYLLLQAWQHTALA